MNRACSVFIATSVDGFIARRDGSIDWLNEANRLVPPGEDCGYAAHMASIDALVMGRNTFEQVLTFGEWPYASRPVVVISRTLKSLPETLPQNVSISSEEPAVLADRLAEAGMARLYVDGGSTIQSFLRAGLITEVTITLIPILLGTGIPLFGPSTGDVRLELVASRSFEFGFVQNRYRVLHAARDSS